MFEYERIYVAVDGSKESDYAFEKALSISKRNKGSTVKAIHVLDKSYRMGMAEMADQSLFREATKFSEQLIHYYEQKALHHNMPCEVILREGSPAGTLLKEFKALLPSDLVVCGSSNLGRIGRLLFGSVSTSIVNESSCDVLVVRTPDTEL